MSEFKQGIFNLLKLLGTSSLALALIYTLGHIIIAMSVVSVMTGASLWEAGAVALICLLYTSPSPRDWTISRMPSSA